MRQLASSQPPLGPSPPARPRHHPSDVLGAYALGLVLALLFYLQAFASPFSGRAGQLAQRGEQGGKRAQAADWLAGEPEAAPVAL